MKDCLLIANSNAVTYKEVFPLIKNNQLRWGYNWVKTFIDTEGNEKPFGNICWFVTLPTANKKKLVLTQSYDPEKCPKYDNYDAIEVSRIKDIPMDYEGVMGVPITFLDHYSPEQFEILGATQRGCHNELPDTRKYDNYLEITQEGTFTGSGGGKTNENANVVGKPNKGNYFIDNNGRTIYSLYQRIFIRRKK